MSHVIGKKVTTLNFCDVTYDNFVRKSSKTSYSLLLFYNVDISVSKLYFKKFDFLAAVKMV